MAPNALDLELENLLDSYQGRVARLELDIPELEELEAAQSPPPPETPVVEEAPPTPVVQEAPVPDLLELTRIPPEPPLLPFSKEEPARAAGPRRWPRVLGAAAVLGVAGLAVWGAFRWQAASKKSVEQIFPLPYTNTTALVATDGELYTLDPKRQLLFILSHADTQVLAVRKFPNPAATGLAKGGDYFWSTSGPEGRIYRHKLDDAFTIDKTFTNPESRPSAVYWDGSHLWTWDERTETVNQYAANGSLQPVNQFALPGISPAGIYVADDRLWIFDCITRRIYRYALGGMLSPEDFLDLSGWITPNNRVTGFAVQKDVLWLISENPAEIRRFDLKALSKSALKKLRPA